MADSVKKILVIDSDPAIRASLKRVFPGAGFQVVFMSLEDALGSAANVSAVVADDSVLLAPGENVALTVIKEKLKCPLLLMTISNNKRLESYARQCGADAVLFKPFSLDDFRRTLWRLIGGEDTQNGAKNREVLKLDASIPVELRGRVAEERAFDDLFVAIERRQPLQEGLDAFDVIESHLIKRALQSCEGNQSHAARFLGITRNTLRKRIKKYGFASLLSGEISGDDDES